MPHHPTPLVCNGFPQDPDPGPQRVCPCVHGAPVQSGAGELGGREPPRCRLHRLRADSPGRRFWAADANQPRGEPNNKPVLCCVPQSLPHNSWPEHDIGRCFLLPRLLLSPFLVHVVCCASSAQSRGCPLKGLHDTPDLEAQKQRFLGAGWDRADAFSMDDIYRRFLDKAELRRIERLEIFDEFEEWHMIQVRCRAPSSRGLHASGGVHDFIILGSSLSPTTQHHCRRHHHSCCRCQVSLPPPPPSSSSSSSSSSPHLVIR